MGRHITNDICYLPVTVSVVLSLIASGSAEYISLYILQSGSVNTEELSLIFLVLIAFGYKSFVLNEDFSHCGDFVVV